MYIKHLYIPEVFSVVAKLKHENFKCVMIYPLPPLIFFFADEVASVFQQEVSFIKLSTAEHTSPWTTTERLNHHWQQHIINLRQLYYTSLFKGIVQAKKKILSSLTSHQMVSNIFFCAQQKKETYRGLRQLEAD